MSTPPPLRITDRLDFDPDALRERYRVERERRIRPDGSGQYRRAEGELTNIRIQPRSPRRSAAHASWVPVVVSADQRSSLDGVAVIAPAASIGAASTAWPSVGDNGIRSVLLINTNAGEPAVSTWERR